MALPNTFDFLKLPVDLLIALDNRPFHFVMQPVHYLVRMLHVMTVAAFFGGIGLLDLRLMGVRVAMPLQGLTEYILPWLWGTCATAMVTGIALFFYDPLHVGAHPYFTMKLLLIVAGGANAAVFHHSFYPAARAARAADKRPPRTARMAGAISLALWIGVIVCACLNVEPPPKLLLLR
jgi:hypothetical protein